MSHGTRKPGRFAGHVVPAGLTKDLPLGLQIVGKAFDEASIYRVGGVMGRREFFTGRWRAPR